MESIVNHNQPMPKIGEKIPVSGDIKDALKNITNQINSAETAFREASSWLRVEHEKLWAAIKEAHPELWRQAHLSYNHETQTLTVVGIRHVEDEG